MYVFRMVFTINSHCFRMQHSAVGLSNFHSFTVLCEVRTVSLYKGLHRVCTRSYKEKPVYIYITTTTWSRVLPEKLPGPQLVKKFLAFYGTRNRIYKRLTPVPILNQINPIVAYPSHFWRCILILSSHVRLGLPSGLFPSGLPTKTLCVYLLSLIFCIL
jgi:hypothetical protein